MPDFSIIGGSTCKVENLGIGASSNGITVAAGSANVKGSWVELKASTSFNYEMFTLVTRQSTSSVFLIDVAVGSAGNEEIIAADLPMGFSNSTTRHMGKLELQLHVPAGSRLSVRVQCSTSSNSLIFSGCGISQGFGNSAGLSKIVSYGAESANSGGTAVVAGSSGVKGSYSELTASTNEDIKSLIISVGLQGANTGIFADVAIGGSGSEEIIIPDLWFYVSTGIMPNCYNIPMSIPAGSRIAIRMQSFTGSLSKDFYINGLV